MQPLPSRLFFTGLACLFGTIAIFWVVVPGVIQWKVGQILRFEEGSEIFQEFTNVPAEILFKVYLFNITNAEDVASGESLPKYQEIGPYVYEEERKNIPIEIDPDADTFTYQTFIVYRFRPDLSNGSDEDVFTMLNVPIVAVANELNNWSSWIRYMAKSYISSFEEPLFVERKVRTALFDGVKPELVESVSELLGLEYLPNNTFGYFYEKNATLSPPFKIHAGFKDHAHFGGIVSFKDQEKMHMWNGDSCNMINGSDTSLYPPFVTKDTVLWGFEADVCRSMPLLFKGEETVEGIKGYRFGLPDDIFKTNTTYNECFCSEEDRSKCPRDGMISVGPCKFGAPLFISHPHFLMADPYYLEHTGLTPGDKEKHLTYMIMEPRVGLVMKGAKRMQINTILRRSSDVAVLNKVQEAIVPLVWINEEVILPADKFDDLKWRMIIPLTVVEGGKWVMLAISSIVTLVGIVIFIMRSKDKKPVEYY